MPLLDHFHPPLTPMRGWESFHTQWCAAIAGRLNQGLLPANYFAEAQVHIGGRVEVDIGTIEQSPETSVAANGSVATTQAVWAPPAPPLVMPSTFPDEISIRIMGGPTGPHLVAAIELVSPGNKDRPTARRTFAMKCATYLSSGIGLLVVDVVTERLANLHNTLMELFQQPSEYQLGEQVSLYAVAYRPVRRETLGDQIEMWPTVLAVGAPLPTMPLALRGSITLPVDLETTYMTARQQSRL
jgi:hypothetical protein